ncbi:unannotated protein [freshwater metagenome]
MRGAPSEPLPTDPSWSGGTLYNDIRVVESTSTPEDLWKAVERIGGDNGWYAANLLWWVRGAFDKAIGGVGLRRGRRDPNFVFAGEPLDFWRVEERTYPEVLRLRAEMKMPGKAWLEFRVEPGPDGGSILRQRAVFWPRGLAGHSYWWMVAPFHAFVFPPMARGIVKQAQAFTELSDTISS